jgi:hypothetical protein
VTGRERLGGAGEIVEFDETFAGRVEGQPLSHKASSPQTFGTETARSLRIGIRSGAEAHWMADVKRFSHQINTDEVFGTHNSAKTH